MVVASANNAAVANVTQEIPQRKAIDDAWAGQAAYLAERAGRVLAAPAWGLVAAALGNKTNRGEFVSRFWHGQSADKTKKARRRRPGFLDWLKKREATATTADWAAAVAAFRAVLADQQRLRDARHAGHDALRRLPRAEQDRADAAGDLHAAVGERDRADVAVRAADDTAAAARHTAWQAQQRRSGAPSEPYVSLLATYGSSKPVEGDSGCQLCWVPCSDGVALSTSNRQDLWINELLPGGPAPSNLAFVPFVGRCCR